MMCQKGNVAREAAKMKDPSKLEPLIRDLIQTSAAVTLLSITGKTDRERMRKRKSE
jgi:hypothetical protein